MTGVPMTIEDILKNTSSAPVRKKAVIPGVRGEELFRFLKAAQHLADFILIGDGNAIKKELHSHGLSETKVISEPAENEACERAGRILAGGDADILIKGVVQTSSFTRILLNKKWGFTPAGSLLSHLSLFNLKSYRKPLFLTDAAINIDPDVDAKEKILRNALDAVKRLGIAHPKAALIAPVEKVSDKIQSTKDAAELKIRYAEASGAVVDGPFGLDAALSLKAAETKGIKSDVCGNPDLLLMPGLDAGNVLYKAFTLIGGAEPAGVVLGASIPAVLTSRSDSVESKLLSLSLALRLA